MANERMDRVVPLDQLDDFGVAEGDPDVRGWEVVASDGRKIGEVDQLLVDTNAMKVRYLDVDVEDDLIASGDERHVLVPIGYARLDRDDKRVMVDTLSSNDLATMPAYEHQPLTRDFEDSVRSSFDRGTSGTAGAARTGDDYYSGESFDDDRFYGRTGQNEERMTLSEEQLDVDRRRMEAGSVGIDKHVETEHVRQEVPVTHEEAVVERRPINDPQHAGGAQITEDEIRVPLNQEEVEVHKRTVPKEELVVRKREVTETETVEADLRKERADIEREGDARVRDESGFSDRPSVDRNL